MTEAAREPDLGAMLATVLRGAGSRLAAAVVVRDPERTPDGGQRATHGAATRVAGCPW
jgi:hypothetical protein